MFIIDGSAGDARGKHFADFEMQLVFENELSQPVQFRDREELVKNNTFGRKIIVSLLDGDSARFRLQGCG